MSDYDAIPNDGKFYINNVCGPFDTWSEATAYADVAHAPQVVRLAPPTPKVKTYLVEETYCNGDGWPVYAKVMDAHVRKHWCGEREQKDTTRVIGRTYIIDAEDEFQAMHAARAAGGTWIGGLRLTEQT